MTSSSSTDQAATATEVDGALPPISISQSSGIVLLVGNSAVLRKVALLLGSSGIATRTCSVASDALAAIRAQSVWVSVLLDHFEDGTAFELAASSNIRGSGVHVILIYGRQSVPDVVRAIRSGSEVRLFPHSTHAEVIAKCCRDLHSRRAEQEARSSERREFPRVIPEGVRLDIPPHSELVDLAPGGLTFRSDSTFEHHSHVDVTLRVGRSATLCLRGRIIRRTRDSLGRDAVALHFVEPSERARRTLLGIAKRHLAKRGLREMQRRFREGSSTDVVPIANRDRIEAFLLQAMNENLSLTIQSATGGLTWQSSVVSMSPSRSSIELAVPPANYTIAPGQTLDALLVHDFESYLFDVTLTDVSLARFRCELPRVIYYSEKRSRIRHQFAHADQLTARVRDPRKYDAWLQFPLLELSSTGASFQVDLDKTLILPGSVLSPLVVTAGDTQILKERGEVRHVTATPDSATHKVGLKFASDPRPPRRAAEHSLRSTLDQSATAAIASKSRLLRFANASGEELVALLNQTTRFDEFSGPTVLMLPSWGRSKESFCGYALNLVENFEHAGEPLAVVRLDYSHHKGESFVPKPNRTPGRESLGFTFSHALEDAQAALEFCFSNPIFSPTSLTLVAPSFNGPLAFRLAARDPRITHLLLPMSTPATRELMKNASGSVDYIGEARRGHRFGLVDFLGLLVDMDAVTADAISAGLAFVSDAEEDVRRIKGRVTWLLGKHDAWIDDKQVERLLRHAQNANVEVVVVDAGHLPTRDESVIVAAEVTRTVMHQHGLETAQLVVSSPDRLDLVQRDEWARAPRTRLSSNHDYWKGYLLGKGEESLGFEVLAFTDAYQEFASVQLKLLGLGPGQSVLDAGAGTGQLAARLFESEYPLPRRLELVDLVQGALDRARRRLDRCARASEVELSWRTVDLQVSQLTPVRRFIDGDYHGLASLRGRIPGLTNQTIDRLESEYRSPLAPLLHRAIRGDRSALDALDCLDQTSCLAVVELGRAARLLRNKVVADDLDPKYALEGKLLLSRGEGATLSTRHLRFDLLEFADSAAPQPLPFVSAKYDRIVCSLVLPYLRNPDETLAELVRALRPGGIIVVSTMKPDTDISGLQRDLVQKVCSRVVPPLSDLALDGLLDELRSYTSAAARLLRLTEEGTFSFLRADELRTLMENAGLTEISLRTCFGSPPQSFVASGRKLTTPVD